MDDADAVIIGGGIAGIASAVRLLEAGIRPVLVERRPYLGGRAFSFVDRESNEEIDNGQHVILGACTEYLELIAKLGQSDQFLLSPNLDIPVVRRGRTASIRATRQFGFFSAVMRYSHLSVVDRVGVLRCGAKLRRMEDESLAGEELTNSPFSLWLETHRQSDVAIERFWNLLIEPVFNTSIQEVPAADAIYFCREVLLGTSRLSAIGVPRSGLSSIMGTPAASYISERGGVLIRGKSATRVAPSDDAFWVVELSSGQRLRTQTVICALPHNDLRDVLPRELTAHRFFEPLKRIQTSPIVGVNIWYEKPVMDHMFAAALESDLQWVFNLSLIRDGAKTRSNHIAVSLSNAERWMAMSKNEVQTKILRAMAETFPAANDNRVFKASVVKSRDATIKILPGSHDERLSQVSPIPGLFLAGDWTDTGLPATMEGAVRSGNRAADAVIGVSGRLTS